MYRNSKQIFKGITRALFARLRKRPPPLVSPSLSRLAARRRMGSESTGTMIHGWRPWKCNAARCFRSTPPASTRNSAVRSKPRFAPTGPLESPYGKCLGQVRTNLLVRFDFYILGCGVSHFKAGWVIL